MGLAASQARLLSITTRLSDNELRAQLINNQKMRLSSESSRVSENYINALNKTNLMFANYGADDKAQNIALTFNNLMAFNQYNNQYSLVNNAGNVLVSESEALKYQEAMLNPNGDMQAEYLKKHGIMYTSSYWNELAGLEQYPNLREFTPSQLRDMYEGTNGVDSYTNTINTSLYTNFATLTDKLVSAHTNIQSVEASRDEAIMKYATILAQQTNLMNGVTSFDSLTGLPAAGLLGLGQLNINLKTLLQQYFEIPNIMDLNAPEYGIDSSELQTAFNNSKITYDSTEGNYYLPRDISELNIEGSHASTQVYGKNGCTDKNALYFSYNDNTYMRIPDLKFDQIGNDTDYTAVNLTDNKLCAFTFDANDNINIVLEQEIALNASENSFYRAMSTGTSGNRYTVTIGHATLSDSDFQPVYTLSYPAPYTSTLNDDNSVNYSTLDIFEIKARQTTSSVGQFSGVTDEQSVFQEIIQGLVTEIIRTADANFGLKKDELGNIQGLTNEEKALINRNTDVYKEFVEIAQEVANSLLAETSIPISIGSYQDAINFYNRLDELMRGITDENYIGETVAQRFERLMGGIQLKDGLQAVLNTFVLDTLMDIYGEPIYKYLYVSEEYDANGDPTGEYIPTEKNGNVEASAEAQWCINLFEKMKNSGYQVLANGLASDPEWIRFALENGIAVMEQVDNEYNWQSITYSSCSDIIEETNNTAATIAEAEYNKAMRQIQAKDERFDLELKNIDTEHASLKAEQDSIKKAMNDNIQRSFQLYS